MQIIIIATRAMAISNQLRKLTTLVSKQIVGK